MRKITRKHAKELIEHYKAFFSDDTKLFFLSTRIGLYAKYVTCKNLWPDYNSKPYFCDRHEICRRMFRSEEFFTIRAYSNGSKFVLGSEQLLAIYEECEFYIDEV